MRLAGKLLYSAKMDTSTLTSLGQKLRRYASSSFTILTLILDGRVRRSRNRKVLWQARRKRCRIVNRSAGAEDHTRLSADPGLVDLFRSKDCYPASRAFVLGLKGQSHNRIGFVLHLYPNSLSLTKAKASFPNGPDSQNQALHLSVESITTSKVINRNIQVQKTEIFYQTGIDSTGTYLRLSRTHTWQFY